MVCGYCAEGYQQTEAGCKPCSGGGGGGIQPIGYVILAVVAVVLIVAIVAAAWWHFFGGAKAAMDAATEELFDVLDENGNGLIDAHELHALVDLYLEETCDDDVKAAARACMEELQQSAPQTHMTLSQFRDVVQSGKLAHVMMRLKNIKATFEQREKLALQACVELELKAAQVTLTEANARELFFRVLRRL